MKQHPETRPVIRCLIAEPGRRPFSAPRRTKVVNLLDLEDFVKAGYVCVAVDPEDRVAFATWLRAHPHAS